MTTITLPPDLEQEVANEAMLAGTTVELLSLSVLQDRFMKAPIQPVESNCNNMAEYLAEYIGAYDSSDKYPGGSTGSRDVGRLFAEHLKAKHAQGKL